ncbi:uncharacterized protein LOC120004983 [Tripterygium wilfordii]|uniref:uncharacterized protein LOC120004983 n=1 Tax=Tripterygium wilfordii TaxID=458696 RepID=UPI0018F812F2|nr:uncharacterized protein LOC120004983 [Tripterygium wilfordii]
MRVGNKTRKSQLSSAPKLSSFLAHSANRLSKLVEAQELYKMEMGKPFQCHHCWELLRDDPKCQASLSSKKQKANTESSSAILSVVNLEDDSEASANQGRPLGRKASKKLLKEKKRGEMLLKTPRQYSHWNFGQRRRIKTEQKLSDKREH